MDYARFGHGDVPFVILPGISVGQVTPSAEAVRASYSAFEDGYTVYLFDRKRNMETGYSTADMTRDTAAAMRALGISGACVFGASQGGMMAMLLAADYPGLVRRAVISSSMVRNNKTSLETMKTLISLAAAGDVRSLNRYMNERLFTEAYREKFALAFAAAEEKGTKEDLERFIIMSEAVLSFDAGDALSRITCPVLVTGVRDDPMLGTGASEEIAREAGCELKLYDGYAHAVYDEAPDHKDVIKEFFDK